MDRRFDRTRRLNLKLLRRIKLLPQSPSLIVWRFVPDSDRTTARYVLTLYRSSVAPSAGVGGLASLSLPGRRSMVAIPT